MLYFSSVTIDKHEGNHRGIQGMVRKRSSSTEAFTIVELLIVIVVIGILAAITIISFNGISARASAAGVQSDLSAAARLLENAKTTSSTSGYPADQTAAQTAGMNSSITYTAALGGYCATKSTTAAVYMITASNPKPHTGPGCTLTNLISNPSFEVNTTGWTAATNVSFTRPATASNGSVSALVTRTATASNGYISTPLATTVGKKYSISFDVRQNSGTTVLNATVKNTSATGTIPVDATTLAINPTGSFTRYTVTWTAESTSSYFVLDATNAAISSYNIDSVMATEGDNSTVYTDPTVSAAVWTWTTPANAGYSTSTGPAF